MMYKYFVAVGLLLVSMLSGIASAQSLPKNQLPQSRITAVCDTSRNTRFCGVDFNNYYLEFISEDYKDSILKANPDVKRKMEYTYPRSASLPYSFVLDALIGTTSKKNDGLFLGTADGSVFVYNAMETNFTLVCSIEGAVKQLLFLEDGMTLAISSDTLNFYLFDLKGEKGLQRLVFNLEKTENTTSYTPITWISINSIVSKAIVTVIREVYDDSWSESYLVDLTTKTIVSKIPNGSCFSSDGDKPCVMDNKSLTFYDKSFNKIAVLSTNWNESLESPYIDKPEEYIQAKIPSFSRVFDTRFFLFWSDFGLILSSRNPEYSYKDTGNDQKEFIFTILFPGRIPYNEIYTESVKLDSSGSPYHKGLRSEYIEHSNGDILISRVEMDTKATIWSRKIHCYSNPGILQNSFLNSHKNTLACLISKTRFSPSADYARSVQYLRFLDWTTGKDLYPPVSLEKASAQKVVYMDNVYPFVILSSGSFYDNMIYWMDTKRLQAFSGTKIVTDKGEETYSPWLEGSVLYTGMGKTKVIPALDGQVGSVVRLAVDPSQRYIATVDEAARFVIRENESGDVLYSDYLRIKDGGELIVSIPVPNLATCVRYKAKQKLTPKCDVISLTMDANYSSSFDNH